MKRYGKRHRQIMRMTAEQKKLHRKRKAAQQKGDPLRAHARQRDLAVIEIGWRALILLQNGLPPQLYDELPTQEVIRRQGGIYGIVYEAMRDGRHAIGELIRDAQRAWIRQQIEEYYLGDHHGTKKEVSDL